MISAQGGDEDAFRELHDLWRADFWRWARLRVDHDLEASEVAQDAWVAIARGLKSLGDPACFSRWALRIVERRCADWVKRRRVDRTRRKVMEDEAESTEPTKSSGESTDVVALREAIASLEPGARELLHLFYETGLSVAEVAEVLAVPEGTIKSRLHTTREQLKRKSERITS
ncbi:MAG: sigma-70 family RNA polymerase sigma factor [Candidatus Synoicihabitans palmerolidicus]|nr:sigma-70 family RNA polymerase sigma factor [Candidatus Synoicihabitans palmerolidicus]